jgi:hypothetical protein
MPRVGAGRIYNVHYENITMETVFYSTRWWGSAEPIYITALPFNSTVGFTGSISNVTMHNIVSNSANGIHIRASPEASISGIRMSNINIQYSNNGNISRPCHDWRPGPGYDELPGGGEGDIVPSNIDGLWIGGETAVNCSLKNSSLQKIGNETFWGVCVNETNSSIEMSNVECDWQ